MTPSDCRCHPFGFSGFGVARTVDRVRLGERVILLDRLSVGAAQETNQSYLLSFWDTDNRPNQSYWVAKMTPSDCRCHPFGFSCFGVARTVDRVRLGERVDLARSIVRGRSPGGKPVLPLVPLGHRQSAEPVVLGGQDDSVRLSLPPVWVLWFWGGTDSRSRETWRTSGSCSIDCPWAQPRRQTSLTSCPFGTPTIGRTSYAGWRR